MAKAPRPAEQVDEARLRASSPGATRAQDLVGPLHRRRRRGERAAHRAARADPDRAAGRPRRDDPADPPTDLVALIRRTRAPRPGGAEDVKHGVSLRPLLHPRSCLPAEGSTRAAAPLAGPIRGPLDGGGLRYRGRAAVPRSERTRHAAAGHKASFIIWLGVSALHVLAHLPATAGSVAFRRSRKPELPGTERGETGRRIALTGALVRRPRARGRVAARVRGMDAARGVLRPLTARARACRQAATSSRSPRPRLLHDPRPLRQVLRPVSPWRADAGEVRSSSPWRPRELAWP